MKRRQFLSAATTGGIATFGLGSIFGDHCPTVEVIDTWQYTADDDTTMVSSTIENHGDTPERVTVSVRCTGEASFEGTFTVDEDHRIEAKPGEHQYAFPLLVECGDIDVSVIGPACLV